MAHKQVTGTRELKLSVLSLNWETMSFNHTNITVLIYFKLLQKSRIKF